MAASCAMGSSNIRDRVMKVVFMDDHQRKPLSTQLHCAFNLSAVAGVRPARVSVRTNNQVIQVPCHPGTRRSAQLLNQCLEISPRVSGRSTREAECLARELDLRAHRTQSHDIAALQNWRLDKCPRVQDRHKFAAKVQGRALLLA